MRHLYKSQAYDVTDYLDDLQKHTSYIDIIFIETYFFIHVTWNKVTVYGKQPVQLLLSIES